MKPLAIVCLLLTGCGHQEAETIRQLQARLTALEARERWDSETITNLVHDVIQGAGTDISIRQDVVELWDYIEAHEHK